MYWHAWQSYHYEKLFSQEDICYLVDRLENYHDALSSDVSIAFAIVKLTKMQMIHQLVPVYLLEVMEKMMMPKSMELDCQAL